MNIDELQRKNAEEFALAAAAAQKENSFLSDQLQKGAFCVNGAQMIRQNVLIALGYFNES